MHRVLLGVGAVGLLCAMTVLAGAHAPASRSLAARQRLASELERAAQEAPNDPALLRKLAVTLERLGRRDAASRYYDIADELDPPPPALKAPIEAPRGLVGPDVIVGEIPDTKRHNIANPRAYTIGTKSCNIGDEPLDWFEDGLQHPIITQNMYRLKDGRFEQIGLAWAKHGFAAFDEPGCGTCMDIPGADQLAPGCGDTYSAQTNGIISRLGPRYEVNAATGAYAWPHAEPVGDNQRGYMRIDTDDLDPAQNANARYFIEGQYVAADDIAAGNGLNNISHREIEILTPAGFPSYDLGFINGADTEVSRPAIEAWKDVDPGVTLVNIDIPGDGRMILGYRVTQLADNEWAYEYALYNQTSHRAARAVAVPLPQGVTPTDIGFHDVAYHSGDGMSGVDVSGADWAVSTVQGAIDWRTDDEATDANANALRWATLYNFRFIADEPPAMGDLTIDLYRAGAPAAMVVSAMVPAADPCPWDLDADGVIGPADLGLLLGSWQSNDILADLTQDGLVNSADLALILGSWGSCP